MIHNTFIKVGDETVHLEASHRWDDDADQPAKSVPAVTAKVVAAPEKKAPRKSAGASAKGT